MELGEPKQIIADRGTAFSSKEFAEFLEAYGCNLHLIATGVPRGNGIVERLMRTVFNFLRATLTADKGKSWIEILPQIENNINCTISSTTNVTPVQLMHNTNLPLSSTAPLLSEVRVPQNNSKDIVEMVERRLRNKYEQTLNRLNRNRQPAKQFSVGTKVLVEDTQAPGRGKLGARYKGPYVIKEILPNDRYCLTKGGKRETVAARDQLRCWPSSSFKD